jgi:two-component system NarL family response regulator
MAPLLRVLVVEDNLLTRLGTASLLSTDPALQVVDLADSAEKGLAAYRRNLPDVVLVDVRMPGMDGIELTRLLVREQPPARVLVLTHYDGEDVIVRALRAGALGYLTKDTTGDELFRAVRSVAAGERYLPAMLAERIAEHEKAPALSPREQQILAFIFEGKTNKEIASAIGRSDRTIGMFVVRLYAKLGVSSRTEAVAVALRRGLLANA